MLDFAELFISELIFFLFSNSGSGLPVNAKVHIQIVGEHGKSKFNRLNVFTSDMFLLTRGSTDLLLLRTKGD